MANKTKTATSRTLDYSLGGDVLDRLKDAERSKYFDPEGKYQGSSGLGKGIDKIIGAAKERRAEFKLEEAKAAKEAEKEDERREVGTVNFDNSFQKLGERNSWTTPYMHSLFTENEMTFKDAYLDAVASGDKVLANNLLNEQNTRYSSVTGWKEAVNSAQSIWDGEKSPHDEDYMGKFSQTLLEDEVSMHVISKINSQEQGSGVTIHTDENHEVYFTIPKYDPKANGGKGGDHATETQNITLEDYQKLTNQVVDEKFAGIWISEVGALYDGAQKGLITEFDSLYQLDNNKKKIKKDNIAAMYKDDIWGTGRSFLEDLTTRPDITKGPGSNFWGHLQNSGFIKDMQDRQQTIDLGGEYISADKGPKDGVLDHMELQALSKSENITDKRILGKILLDPANFEIAKYFLAEWMTLYQQQNFEKGRGNKDFKYSEANLNK